jgi:hypothetical protein
VLVAQGGCAGVRRTARLLNHKPFTAAVIKAQVWLPPALVGKLLLGVEHVWLLANRFLSLLFNPSVQKFK